MGGQPLLLGRHSSSHVLKELLPASINFSTRAETPEGLRGILGSMLTILRGIEEIAMTPDDP